MSRLIEHLNENQQCIAEMTCTMLFILTYTIENSFICTLDSD